MSFIFIGFQSLYFIHPFSDQNVSIQPVYLLVGAFNPFTFKVVIDMYVPITIFLTVLGLLL